MSEWSPPSRSRRWKVGVELLCIVVFGYALVLGQFLLGVLAVVGVWLLYVLWRFLHATEAIADALYRIADQREAD